MGWKIDKNGEPVHVPDEPNEPGAPGSFAKEAAAAEQARRRNLESQIAARDRYADQRGQPTELRSGQLLVGGRLLRQAPSTYADDEVYDPTTGQYAGQREIPGQFAFEPTPRDPLDDLYRQAQIAKMLAPAAGRQRFASEDERDLAAAAENRANAAYIEAKRAGYPEELALRAAEQAAQQAQQEAQTELGRARLAQEGRQFLAQQGLAEQRLGLDERRFGLEESLGRGRLGLERELGFGRLGVEQGQLALAGETARGRLGLDTRALENQIAQAGADRGLRRDMALGTVEGQQTLEAELGRRGAGVAERGISLQEDLGRARLGNETAGLYGIGPDGRPTLQANLAAGMTPQGVETLEGARLFGGRYDPSTGGQRQTLENVFGRAGLTGTLDGQDTLAGRQQREAETEARFRRVSTPSAAGNIAALQQRGLLGPSASRTGDVSGLRSPAVSTFGSPSGSTAPASQGPVQFSLQSMRGLSPRDTEALGGYTAGMGRDLSDVRNQAENEVAALGEGLPARRRMRLGPA